MFFRSPAPTPPALPPGQRVYAVGDVHGCLDRLKRLLAVVEADAAGGPEAPTLVYLGDYVDRGPQSRGVLELLLAGPPPGFRALHLRGNHEEWFQRVLEGEDGPELVGPWLDYGGGETCRSYGVDPQPPGLARRLCAAVPAAHRAFLEGLADSWQAGDYFFCHAGVRPGVALQRQRRDDLLWIREPFLSHRGAHPKVVVHGHTPCEAPEERGNRIGIDTGCVYGGRLTALALEGRGRRFLQA